MRMKYGYELEAIVGYKNPILKHKEGYHSGNYVKGIRVEDDCSLSDDIGIGVEIITAPFSIRTMKAREIRIRELLPDIDHDIWVNDTCGAHVAFSSPDYPIQKLITYPVIEELRGKLFNIVPPSFRNMYIQNYYRSYARKVTGYSDYKSGKYRDFNIRDNYIEWRGVHVRHLEMDTFLDDFFSFMRQVVGIIDETVKRVASEGMCDTFEFTQEEEIEELIPRRESHTITIPGIGSRREILPPMETLAGSTLFYNYHFNN